MADALSQQLDRFPVTLELPVQWGDQDASGHVNPAVPILWFESSRAVCLQQCGLSGLMQRASISPIVASVSCEYHDRLTYPDEVVVAACAERIGRSSVTIVHQVFSRSLRRIAVEGESVVVMYDFHANRPVRMPADVQTALEQLAMVDKRHRG